MLAKVLMVAGVILLAAGLLLYFQPGLLSWFGRLPGDIRMESGRTKVFIPITSMVLVSIVASLLLAFFRR